MNHTNAWAFLWSIKCHVLGQLIIYVDIHDWLSTGAMPINYTINANAKCKRDEARIRADILADDLVKRNTTLFWSHVS